MMKQPRWLKIIVPAIILLAVAGIWASKNVEFSPGGGSAVSPSPVPTAAATLGPATTQADEPAATAAAESPNQASDSGAATEVPLTPATEDPASTTAGSPVSSATDSNTRAPEKEDAPVPGAQELASLAETNPDFALDAKSIDLKALTAYGLPIIIDFGADSCEPCKAMAPVLKKMNTETRGSAIIRFVDVWKNPRGADGFPIQVIPTQIIITADGKPYVPSEDIGIQFTLYRHKETKEHAFTAHQGGLTEAQMRAILDEMGGT